MDANIGLAPIFGVIDIVISVWNAYASGYNSIILRQLETKNPTDWKISFYSIANQFALVLAFAGATYGTALLLGYVLYALHYIAASTLIALLSLNGLVFGGLIVFTGIVIAIQSIIQAYYTRRGIDILVAVYNIIASIWNVFAYISSFEGLLQGWESSSEEDKNRALIIIAIAVIIGIILTFYAYQMGRKKALAEIGRLRVSP